MLNQLAGQKRNLHLRSNWRAGINGEEEVNEPIVANGDDTPVIE